MSNITLKTQTRAKTSSRTPSRTSRTSQHKFSTVGEVRQALKDINASSLVDSLATLRNQLTIRGSEPPITPQDGRLLLAKQWIELSPGAEEVINLLDKGNHTAIASLSISVLACLITLLNSHLVYQPLGQPIVKSLLSPQWMRTFESYLSGSTSDLTMATLKLLNAISLYSGGAEQRVLLESLAWDAKLFNRLLFMRRKAENIENFNMLERPDIRTLCVQLILSLISPSSSHYVKVGFLEQHRGVFMSIFRGLNNDSYAVAQMVLEACWTNVWQDPKLKRTLKVGLFNETTLQHIIKLYDLSTPEISGEQTPADLAHHFLLAICTHRGIGVCFSDRGWYPRDNDEQEHQFNEDDPEAPHRKSVKVYNKILANVLKTLKVNEDARQQELALKILASCPELVASYWRAVSLTLEPRLSSKWLANIAFFGSVISLPIPADSFLMRPSTPSSSSTAVLYEATPPPLSIVMENLLPSVNLKPHFTKGLQSSSALVQHSTAVALVKCLMKCKTVYSVFRKIEAALEEDETNGQWANRIREVEREFRKRVPDFQVIVAFSQQKPTSQPGAGLDAGLPTPSHSAKASLLSEIAQRLLWLYHRCVPSLVAEARFDVGKSLQLFLDGGLVSDESGKKEATSSAIDGLEHLRQLHVLRMLKESDQFTWSSKSSSSTHSNVYILLKAYVKASIPAIRDALAALLIHALSDSLMFRHDPDEMDLWLDSLPATVRAADAEAPDGAPLTDEGESVVAFLDDCMQRCIKTPYRYLEDMATLVTTAGIEDSSQMEVDDVRAEAVPSEFEAVASPLLMAVTEQLMVKVKNQLLSASDTLALVTYIRRLVVKLLMKSHDARFFEAVTLKLTSIVHTPGLFSAYPAVLAAVRREITLLKIWIKQTVASETHSLPLTETSSAVQEFLRQVEALPIPQSQLSRRIHAYELIDWLRLVHHPIHSSEVERLIAVIERFHPESLPIFCSHLSPDTGLLWMSLNASSAGREKLSRLSFDLLFLQARSDDLRSPVCRDALVQSLRTHRVTLPSSKRYLSLFLHRLRNHDHPDTAHNISLMVEMIKLAKASLSHSDQQSLKTFTLIERRVLRDVFCMEELPQDVSTELDRLIVSLVDPAIDEDRSVVSGICRHWLINIKHTLAGKQRQPSRRTLAWIKFMDLAEILHLLELAMHELQHTIDSFEGGFNLLLDELLASIHMVPSSTSSDWLRCHLPELIALRRLLPNSSTLEEILTIAVATNLPIALDGQLVPSSLSSLSSLLSVAESRWKFRLSPLSGELDFLSLLNQDVWSEQLPMTIAGLIYGSSYARQLFWRWMDDDDQIQRIGITRLVIPLHAFFDSSADNFYSDMPLYRATADSNMVQTCFEAFASYLYGANGTPEKREVFSSCIARLLERLPAKHVEYIRTLRRHLSTFSFETLHREALDLASVLPTGLGKAVDDLIQSLIDHGLQWSVQFLSQETRIRDADNEIIKDLSALVKIKKTIPAHFAEPVLVTAIRSHLLNVNTMDLCATLFSSISLKPVNVNRHLQSILQHPQVRHIEPAIPDGPVPARDSVIRLLHYIFNSHPSNTCQPSHIQPLIRLYGGTLSTADRKLFSIFHLFEAQRKASVASIFSQWSASHHAATQNCLDSLTSLDPGRVLRSCLEFPSWRSLDIHVEPDTEGVSENNPLYDPVFVILLLAQVMLESPPESAVSWVELFRTNAVCLVIRALSSRDPSLRQVALLQVTSLWKSIQTADLHEKALVMYILDLLRGLLPLPSEEPPARLPSYTTLVLVHALRGVFYPSNFIYPLTARFLLQRPELDPHDIPLLYGMLYSSSDDWKKERGWMLRFLGDGMSSTLDWRLFKRRHTWDLLASLFQSSANDRALRLGAMEVLASLTCNQQAATSLVLKSSLIQWIEAQMHTVKSDERIAWIKIFENILVVTDAGKLEQATKGEWRSGLLRSLNSLLKGADVNLLRLASRALLRFGCLPLPPSPSVFETAAAAVCSLKNFETTSELLIQFDRQAVDGKMEDAQPPHRNHGLHQLVDMDDLLSWGKIVENLWQVTMRCESKDAAWDGLSYRILIWRSIAGERGSPVGDWVRREVVSCLSENK